MVDFWQGSKYAPAMISEPIHAKQTCLLKSVQIIFVQENSPVVIKTSKRL